MCVLACHFFVPAHARHDVRRRQINLFSLALTHCLHQFPLVVVTPSGYVNPCKSLSIPAAWFHATVLLLMRKVSILSTIAHCCYTICLPGARMQSTCFAIVVIRRKEWDGAYAAVRGLTPLKAVGQPAAWQQMQIAKVLGILACNPAESSGPESSKIPLYCRVSTNHAAH